MISVSLFQDLINFIIRTGHPWLEINPLAFDPLLDYPFTLPRISKQKNTMVEITNT
ncbi:hypothetical protein L293_2615 [Acinetobacter gyllenbergii CIP 110306 = MTCC 11365]|nr:hypothetical protein L293_2615 [Acinetobacter gyllenbergii CIP 110306 = MTCC 11365]